MKMRYPKTPRHLWLHVKVSPLTADLIKKERQLGSTYEEIGEKFDVSRETARIYSNNIRRRPSRKKAPTPEQKRKAYLRKKEILGDELREYRKSLYK